MFPVTGLLLSGLWVLLSRNLEGHHRRLGVMQGGKKQYGLQLQIKGPPKKLTARSAPAPAFRFIDGDDEDGVESDIARQANKKRSVREVEQQYQKALEEDPTAFDYDGVYEEMKGNQVRSIHEDRAKREPKYIGKLLQKAKERSREQDIVYERQLAKEREKEDHLYGDKEKFVTGAYKRKLQEQAKWLEEERRRELEEQKHEVTNKSDMSDFYRNLLKSNVAFGANNTPKPAQKDAELPGPPSQVEDETKPSTSTAPDVDLDSGLKREERREQSRDKEDKNYGRRGSEIRDRNESMSPSANRSRSRDRVDRNIDKDDLRPSHKEKSVVDTAQDEEIGATKETKISESKDVKKPAVDPVAAAKERYLARKRQRGL